MNYKRNARSFWLCVLLFILLACYARCEAVTPNFLNAIHQVESSGRMGPIWGENHTALGPMQIHYAYWRDANVPGRWADCADYNYSCRVVTAYLKRYAAIALLTHDYETLARIHNGGPKGQYKRATYAYWLRVKKHLTN